MIGWQMTHQDSAKAIHDLKAYFGRAIECPTEKQNSVRGMLCVMTLENEIKRLQEKLSAASIGNAAPDHRTGQ